MTHSKKNAKQIKSKTGMRHMYVPEWMYRYQTFVGGVWRSNRTHITNILAKIAT